MNILYSGFIDPNHSSFGGYHNIINYPDASKILLSENYFLGKLDKRYRLRKIPLTLLDLDTRIKRHKYDIVHLFYGEITLCPFIPLLKSKKHKTVITLHLDILKQKYHNALLKRLKEFDGIIVLSSQQKEYYLDKFGIKSTFIPHGFNTPTFLKRIPQDINGQLIDNNKINLIISGKNYRNFNVLKEVISFFINNNEINFHLVGSPNEIKKDLYNYKNVRIYGRLSNDEYYTLLQKCDYNFLPVSFATANNALLEAQSLGVKSILPRIPGILDYSSPDNIFYDDDNIIKTIQGLDKSNISNQILDYSKNFHWDKIYVKLHQFYSTLISNQ